MIKFRRFVRKTACALALVLAFSGVAAVGIGAYATTEGVVTASALNIRQEPSVNSACIGTYKANTKIEIISAEGDWYKVKANGITGYVSSKYVKVSGENAVSSSSGKVHSGPLNMRSSASTKASVVASLPVGTQVSVVAKDGNWLLVKATVAGKSCSGYVYAEYITLGGSTAGSGSSSSTSQNTTQNVAGKTGYCTVYALNVRSAAATTSSVVGCLTQNSKVTIDAVVGKDWYKITATINGKKISGYVYADYIKVSGSDDSSVNTSTSTSSEGSVKIKAAALNIRSNASTAGSIVGVLYEGAVVKYTEVVNGWYKISTTISGKNVTGYVSGSYVVKVSSDSSSSSESTSSADQTWANKKGVIYGSAMNFRSQPSTASSILGSLSVGTEVTILEKTNEDWYKVIAKINGKDVTGYVYRMVKLAGSTTSEDSKDPYKEVNETVWATEGVNIRSAASTESKVLTVLAKGAHTTRIGVGSNGWSKVKFGASTGYVKSDYLTTKNPNPGSEGISGEAVVKFALQYEGYPYVWGGNDLNTGVDCSGFTQQVYLNFGIKLNRSADDQRANGYKVSLDDLKPGDLLFYGSSTAANHVALYIGDGKVIHASQPTVGIIISPYNYRTPMQANRVIY